ncbi:MAG TPA: hypothetical protein ENF45_06690 [Bacteroidetes bacterium]|nr:hypothetical protein [Bacteroidota bacterium]
MRSSEIFEEFKDIILEVAFEERILRKGITLYKAKIILADGSNLRVSEKYIESGLDKYSYYWLDEVNELIIGLDNATHHSEIESYPHHKHVGLQKRIEPSLERNLRDVLSFIRKALG